MKTQLLREIDARVERVEPKLVGADSDPAGPPATSTRYVFGLRPLRKRRASAQHYLDELQGSYAPRGWWESESDDSGDSDEEVDESPEDDGVPVAHEVARTYSQCRELYARLLELTDRRSPAVCCCARGSCPFWSLAAVLRRVSFPRKTLFNYQSPRVSAARALALSAMMREVLGSLRGCYRAHHFREQPAPPARGVTNCKVLGTLGVFLELDDPAVEDKLRICERRLHGRLSLEGWLVHRRSSLLGNGPLLTGAMGHRLAGTLGGGAKREHKAADRVLDPPSQPSGFMI